MKTFKTKTSRLIAMMALLVFCCTSAFANVKVYRSAGYKGGSMTVKTGEYSAGHFYKLLGKSSYCSIKVPTGFCVEIDYFGKGWKSSKISSYSSNASKVKCGFKKIRIIQCGPSKGENPGYHDKQEEGCGSHWAVKFYSERNYKGKVGCFPKGEHRYKGHYAKSIKVAPGYECLCIAGGKVVKRVSGGLSYYRGKFDSFKVVKKGSSYSDSPKEEGCGSHWAVKFYSERNYKGKVGCFPKGEHRYKGHYAKSIKVAPGYECLCIAGGKVVKRVSGGLSYYRGKFDSFKVVKKGQYRGKNGRR